MDKQSPPRCLAGFRARDPRQCRPIGLSETQRRVRTAVRGVPVVPHARSTAITQRKACVSFRTGSTARITGGGVRPLAILGTEHCVYPSSTYRGIYSKHPDRPPTVHRSYTSESHSLHRTFALAPRQHVDSPTHRTQDTKSPLRINTHGKATNRTDCDRLRPTLLPSSRIASVRPCSLVHKRSSASFQRLSSANRPLLDRSALLSVSFAHQTHRNCTPSRPTRHRRSSDRWFR